MQFFGILYHHWQDTANVYKMPQKVVIFATKKDGSYEESVPGGGSLTK